MVDSVGSGPAERDDGWGSRVRPELTRQPDRLDRHRAGVAPILAITQRHDAWLIADEVYSRLIYDGSSAAPSLLDIANPADGDIVCNSFSKAWMMTGWRLGWLVVPEGAGETIVDLVEVSHSGVAPFIQRAGIAAIADTAAAASFRHHCATGRTLASEALAGLNGIRYRPPDGAFYAFFSVDGLHDSLVSRRNW